MSVCLREGSKLSQQPERESLLTGMESDRQGVRDADSLVMKFKEFQSGHKDLAVVLLNVMQIISSSSDLL